MYKRMVLNLNKVNAIQRRAVCSLSSKSKEKYGTM